MLVLGVDFFVFSTPSNADEEGSPWKNGPVYDRLATLFLE